MPIYRSKPPVGTLPRRGHPLMRGLVSSWLMNEGAGIRANDNAGDNPLTAEGGVSWKGGKFGVALSFDGVDDACSALDSPSLRLPQPSTISFWVKPGAISGGYQCLVAKRLSGDASFQLYLAGGTNALGYYSNTAGVVGSSLVPPSDVWSHVAYVINGAASFIYLNGAREAVTMSIGSMNDGKVDIGAWGATASSTGPATSNFFAGSLDLIHFHGRALSEYEISQLRDEPFARFSRPTARYVSAGSGFQAAWARGSNSIIGVWQQ